MLNLLQYVFIKKFFISASKSIQIKKTFSCNIFLSLVYKLYSLFILIKFSKWLIKKVEVTVKWQFERFVKI